MAIPGNGLTDGLEQFLAAIDRLELLERLTVREEWQLIAARSPQDKKGVERRSMAEFRKNVWDAKLGKGGIVGDLTDLDRSAIPLITHGDLRRFVPVWENRKFKAPCESTCPSGIPVQERWRLVREGRVDEAVDLALAFTPFPASVCGYLCPPPLHDRLHQRVGVYDAGGRVSTGPGQHQGQHAGATASFR